MTIPLPQPLTLRRSLATIFLSVLLSSGQAMASDSVSTKDWDITADKIIQYDDQETLVATGHVVLVPKEKEETAQKIQGDWLAYDLNAEKLKLRGNIKINGAENGVDSSAAINDIIISQQAGGKNSHYLPLTTLGAWSIASKKGTLVPAKVIRASKEATEAPKARPTTKPAPGNMISTEEWNITADKLTRFQNPSSIVATGNVVLKKRELIPPAPTASPGQATSPWHDLLQEPNQAPKKTTVAQSNSTAPPQYRTTTTIHTDWLAYDVERGMIKAKGNVLIESDKGILTAAKGEIKLEDETGTFHDASLRQEDMLYLEGKKIARTGYDTYRIEDGWVITCKLEEGETPPWAIVSSETDIKQDGYAVLKHARFHVKGVPVFYLPYMIIPINQTRKTGFLYPEMSASSNSGFGLNLPFFWAISDSTDASLYPQYYARRGFMPGTEFRYATSADKKGTFNATYLHDKLESSETKYTYQNSDRYWIRAKSDHTFGDGWLARLDLDIVSDKDYLQEFDSGIDGYDQNNVRYLDNFGRGFANDTEMLRNNTFKVMKGWNNMFLEMEVLGVNDVRTDADGKRIKTDNPFWKLPSITYSGAIPLGETALTFDWDSGYVNYWREDGYGGHRFDLHPKISTNLPLSEYLESRAELGLRDTYYMVENYGDPVGADEWTKGTTPNRLLYDFEVEVATTVERDFYSSGTEDSGFTHQIRPYVRYNFVPEEDQENLPFFDSTDRIDQQNGVTYGFDTYLNQFGSTKKEYAHLEVKQTYYLDDVIQYDDNGKLDLVTDDLSEIEAKLKWYPWRNTYLSYKTEYDVYGEGFVSHTLTTSYKTDRGDSVALQYSKRDEDDIDEINGYFKLYLADNWFTQIDIEHSIFDNETQVADFSLTYTQPCWSVTMGYESTPEDEKLLLVFTLANIGLPISAGAGIR